MAVRVVYFLESVQVEKQKAELACGALGSLNLGVNNLNQMAIISQPRERIFGGLLPQTILQLALLGNIFNDDLVTVFLAVGTNSASAKPNLQRRPILSSP